ncbi:glutamate N-acetyltransferase, partial [Tieghemiomyces parasiticus]
MRGFPYQQVRTMTSKARFVPSEGYYPRGFTVTGLHCGVKKDPQKLDLALLHSKEPCSAAAVFTQNKFCAAPVQVSRAVLDGHHGTGVHGVVTNSGCANAVTGTTGLANAKTMARSFEQATDTPAASTL